MEDKREHNGGGIRELDETELGAVTGGFAEAEGVCGIMSDTEKLFEGYECKHCRAKTPMRIVSTLSFLLNGKHHFGYHIKCAKCGMETDVILR